MLQYGWTLKVFLEKWVRHREQMCCDSAYTRYLEWTVWRQKIRQRLPGAGGKERKGLLFNWCRAFVGDDGEVVSIDVMVSLFNVTELYIGAAKMIIYYAYVTRKELKKLFLTRIWFKRKQINIHTKQTKKAENDSTTEEVPTLQSTSGLLIWWPCKDKCGGCNLPWFVLIQIGTQ